MTQKKDIYQTRIAELRNQFKAFGISAYYIPKVDEYMGEYIRPCDERLEYISGFSGSAGFALITQTRAALFVDSRYTIQAKTQSPDFEILDYPDIDLINWLGDEILGVDANLLAVKDAQNWQNTLGENLKFTPNLIDQIWTNRPSSENYTLQPIALELTGTTSAEKFSQITQSLKEANVDAFLSNNPESIAWLLNFRGGEIPMLPAPMGYMLVAQSGVVDVFGVNTPEFDCLANFHKLENLNEKIAEFQGIIGFDEAKLPIGRYNQIEKPLAIKDPIIRQKSRKNAAELKASLDAHQEDAIAMIRFLAWLDAQDPRALNEIKCAERLLAFRKESPNFITSSFATISAWNANAANAHYHATKDNFAHFEVNGIYLVDSGAHYPGATTDITRTQAIGNANSTAHSPYTNVLNGLANISQAKFPIGSTGRDIDPLARIDLWKNNRNYGHGTGHGIGAQLSVHEGPVSISPRSAEPLAAGMILSLEPGYYEEGAFGIRLENLAHIKEYDGFLSFQTLSYVPIDVRLIDPDKIWPQTIKWLNKYHKITLQTYINHLDEFTRLWLKTATMPL